MGDDDGYVIVVVLGLMMVALTIGAAALALTLHSNHLSLHDMRVRRAQQAADAGIQAQVYNAAEADLGSSTYSFNGGPIGLSNFLDCTVPKLNVNLQITGVVSTYANSQGICPTAVNSSNSNVTNQTFPVGNHTTYQSEMITGQTNLLNGTTISGQNGSAMRELFPKIVSIGTENSQLPAGASTVYSREEAILAPIAPLQAIEGENSVTIGGLQACIVLLGCANLASTLNGNVLDRGNLTLPSTAFLGLNLSNSLIATLVYGGSVSGGNLTIGNLKQVSTSSIIQRSSPTISSSKASCSVAANCTALGATYNSATDTFSMSSGTVTFQAGDYVFCSFNATGGTVNVNPTSSAPVRIFIDSPNSTRCAADKAANDPNIGSFNDTAGFTNQLLNTGGLAASSGMQVYVVGDGAYDDKTSVQIGPTSTSGLLTLSKATYGAIVYAPTSKVTINVPAVCVSLLVSACTGGIFEGAAIGNDTTINALTITQDLDIGNYPLYAGVNAFRVTQYVQCDNTLHSLTGNASDTNGC
jgi:hypothetical protein